MTEKNENTTEKGVDAEAASPDAMTAAMEKCGGVCASMMARFFQRHQGAGTADEKAGRNGCC